MLVPRRPTSRLPHDSAGSQEWMLVKPCCDAILYIDMISVFLYYFVLLQSQHIFILKNTKADSCCCFIPDTQLQWCGCLLDGGWGEECQRRYWKLCRYLDWQKIEIIGDKFKGSSNFSVSSSQSIWNGSNNHTPGIWPLCCTAERIFTSGNSNSIFPAFSLSKGRGLAQPGPG